MNAQLPILDMEILERMRADYGEETLAELIEDFRHIGKESIKGFNKAVDAGDQKSMMRYAHDLKSSAAALGLKRLSELSRNIEMASKEGRLDEAVTFSPDLEPSLAEAIGILTGTDS